MFCSYCARTFNVKLCPRLHVNPRNAQVCSQCGSRDLSTPQPKVPFWVPILEVVLKMIPGAVLAVVSVLVMALFALALLSRPALLVPLVFVLCGLGFLWWTWSRIPSSFRHFIYELLKRRREGQQGRH